MYRNLRKNNWCVFFYGVWGNVWIFLNFFGYRLELYYSLLFNTNIQKHGDHGLWGLVSFRWGKSWAQQSYKWDGHLKCYEWLEWALLKGLNKKSPTREWILGSQPSSESCDSNHYVRQRYVVPSPIWDG